MNRVTLVAKLRTIRAIIDEALASLEAAPSGRNSSTPATKSARAGGSRRLSFDVNILAFMKKHGRGLAGPQKFTILLAHLAKGSKSVQVPAAELRKQWNKMRSVLGDSFNSAYANRAKANGWVDAPKFGVYVLSSSWNEAIGSVSSDKN